MPIRRTYMCGDCANVMEVTLSLAEADAPPPICPVCRGRPPMRQDFKPVAIGGSNRSKAVKIAENIAEKDYGVADMNIEGKEGVRNKVRYKQAADNGTSWGASSEALHNAIALGRETRLQHGSGLDIIKSMPDLIAESKKRSMRVW